MPVIYEVPANKYLRLHHVRPRFKNNLENVLFFISQGIVSLGALTSEDFKSRLNNIIRRFPGNVSLEEKTVNNWRTEIAALFGFIVPEESGFQQASHICRYLAEKEDLIGFFRWFLIRFQYPGSHLKAHEIKELVDHKVLFHPARYLLQILLELSALDKGSGLSKEEATHCIFNDLRVTADHRSAKDTVETIIANREAHVLYDTSGDVIRYASDILDYLVLANFLIRKLDGKYYLKNSEKAAAIAFIEEVEVFDDYYTKGITEMVHASWLSHVNLKPNLDRIATSLEGLFEGIDSAAKSNDEMTINIADVEDAKRLIYGLGVEKIQLNTKMIGDLGENLILGHEKQCLAEASREDLLHLVKSIPTHLGMGYDIKSVSPEGQQKFVEVKTTISKSKLTVNSFHLTPNEWNVATDNADKYYVYRLMISETGLDLFIIVDPVRKYKNDIIRMYMSNGANITFTADDKTGCKEALKTWKN